MEWHSAYQTRTEPQEHWTNVFAILYLTEFLLELAFHLNISPVHNRNGKQIAILQLNRNNYAWIGGCSISAMNQLQPQQIYRCNTIALSTNLTDPSSKPSKSSFRRPIFSFLGILTSFPPSSSIPFASKTWVKRFSLSGPLGRINRSLLLWVLFTNSSLRKRCDWGCTESFDNHFCEFLPSNVAWFLLFGFRAYSRLNTIHHVGKPLELSPTMGTSMEI